MIRDEIYSKISPCGGIDFHTTRLLINSVKINNPATRSLLLDNVAVNGGMSKSDWIYFLDNVVFLDNPTVRKDVAIGWLETKCNLTGKQLIELIESLEFMDKEEPTYLKDGLLYLIDA